MPFDLQILTLNSIIILYNIQLYLAFSRSTLHVYRFYSTYYVGMRANDSVLCLLL